MLFSLTVALLVITPTLLCSTENIYADVGDEPRLFGMTAASQLQNRQNSDRDHLGERFPSKRGREVNHDWGAKSLNVSLPPVGGGKGSVNDDGYMAPRQGTPPPGYHELDTKSTPVVRGQLAASCKQDNFSLSVESIYLTPISDEEAEEMELEKKDKSGMRGKRNGSFVDDGCYLDPRSCQGETEDIGKTQDDGYLAPDSCRVDGGAGSMEISTQSLTSLDVPIIYTPASGTPFVATPVAATPVVATPTVDTPTLATPTTDTPSPDAGIVLTPNSEAALDESSKRRTIYAAQKLPPAPPVPTSPVPDT